MRSGPSPTELARSDVTQESHLRRAIFRTALPQLSECRTCVVSNRDTNDEGDMVKTARAKVVG